MPLELHSMLNIDGHEAPTTTTAAPISIQDTDDHTQKNNHC